MDLLSRKITKVAVLENYVTNGVLYADDQKLLVDAPENNLVLELHDGKIVGQHLVGGHVINVSPNGKKLAVESIQYELNQ